MPSPTRSNLPLLTAPILPEHNPDLLHKQPNYRAAIFSNDPNSRLSHRHLSPPEVMKLFPQSPVFASTKIYSSVVAFVTRGFSPHLQPLLPLLELRRPLRLGIYIDARHRRPTACCRCRRFVHLIRSCVLSMHTRRWTHV
uniref:Uncharacterized protein n=1 Tax=Arundo donax TaxID=35708 RepID=A0A0A8XZV7_ARUDO